jgi:hypothetical protein
MVLISMQPFADRKIFLLALALLCLSSVFCFADSLFMARRYAPSKYDSRGEINVMAPADTGLVDSEICVDPELQARTISLVAPTSVCVRHPVGFTRVRSVDCAAWPGLFFQETDPQNL